MNRAILFWFAAFLSSANPFRVEDYPLLTKKLNCGNDECCQSLQEVIESLKNVSANPWAWKMLDASSKLRSGILVANDDIGNFDECLSVENANGSIYGKYCLGGIPLGQFTGLTKTFLEVKRNARLSTGTDITRLGNLALAICVPNVCTAEQLNQVQKSLKISVVFNDNYCYTKNDDTTLTTGALLTLFFFGAIIVIILAETFYDLYCQHSDRKPKLFFIAFSAYTNSAKLFTFSQSNNQLQCLNGLKFYSMMWVIIGHTFFLSFSAPSANHLDWVTWAAKLRSMVIVSGPLSVDTFFVVGGVLVSYLSLQAIEKKKFNVFIFYLHRYIRLTPALAALILVTANLLPYFGSGPHWADVRANQDLCQSNWLPALLYIQNYVSTGHLCAGHSWYLSVDTQLYVLAPLILYGFSKYPKATIAILIAIITAICSYNFVVAWQSDYSAILTNPYFSNNNEFLSTFYVKTHVRASTWIMGIIIGYLVYQIKTGKIKFQPKLYLNTLGWICCLVAVLICIFIGHHGLRQPGHHYLGNSLHIALIRPLWAVALGWIIITCIFGYGGPVNWFLSWPIYQIFCKFLYSIYLVHYIILILLYSSIRIPIYFSELTMTYNFFSNLCFACLASYFWVIAFESPIVILEKILLDPILRPKRATDHKVVS